jgi:Arc/MetJ-type ribon-helix-helix transcriptional regulator
MIVRLTSVQSRMLNQVLRHGKFASPESAIAEGLAMLKQRQEEEVKQFAEMKRAVIAGARQVRNARTSRFDADAASRIKARGRRLLSASAHASKPAA